MREITEMRYEFDEPFIVDASRAQTELGLRATPLTDAVEQTVRWYREHSSRSRSSPTEAHDASASSESGAARRSTTGLRSG